MPLYEGANACHSSDLKFLYAVSRFYTLTHRRKSEVGSEPKIIHLTAVRSLGGLQASLSLILSLYVFLFLFCCSSVLLSFTLFHCFLSILSSLALCASHFAISLRNVPLQLANLNWRIKIKVVNSFLHFFLPPHHFLSFDFLCFKASYSLLKYAIERHIWPSKTISNLINNCQVRGKAEWVWTTLKAHQRPQKGEAWGWGKVDDRRYAHVQI